MEDPIIEPVEQTTDPIIEEPQVEEPKPMEYKEPEIEDTYDKAKSDKEFEDFKKEIENRYPVKGEVKLDDVDTKNPAAIKDFFAEMQRRSRDDITNENARQKALDDYKAQQENKHWETAYKAYPKLRDDKDTDSFVHIVQKGADCSPLQAANFVNKFVSQVYNAGFNAARSHTQQVPSKPLGTQQKAAPVRINEKALYEKAAGSDDDLAEAVAALQKAGVGGL